MMLLFIILVWVGCPILGILIEKEIEMTTSDMSWPQVADDQDNGQAGVFIYGGGSGAIYVTGTFDSATVKLEFSPDNGTTWFDLVVDLTEEGITGFTCPPSKMRVDVSGGLGSESIDVYVQSDRGG